MKEKVIFLLLPVILGMAPSAFGQGGIGVGTDAPDSSAVLHVQPPENNRGLLIPRLTSSQRSAISAPANGLLVYDVSLNQFCYYNEGWYVLNEMVRSAGSSTVSHVGDVSINGSVTLNALNASGTISAPNYALNTTGNGPIPQGGIIMWSGAVVPHGWALCDGGEGRPDLSDRFIVAGGPGTSYAIGETGGVDALTLTVQQLPAHSHQILGQWGGDNSDNNNTARFAGGDKGPDEAGFFFSTNSQLTGGGQPVENRPRYYALAFIIKL